jgi:beta-galactosidase
VTTNLSWNTRLILLSCACLSATAADGSTRERLSFDPGWRFVQNDVPFPMAGDQVKVDWHTKTGTAEGAAATSFDDSSWRTLNLPHDWVSESGFDAKLSFDQGYRPRGISWYRKRFAIPASDRGKNLELAFDGIATHATVWINGALVHRHFNGFTSFTIDLTPFVRYGNKADNVIAVRVDASEAEGWFYEGGGIYRHTWLTKRAPLHIATDGVFANPIKTQGNWGIPVEVTLANKQNAIAKGTVESVLIDPDGAVVARGSGSATLAAFDQGVVKFSIPVTSPRLWSVDKPTLYRVKTTLSGPNDTKDTVETTCGFRTLRFDADKGFFLNDQPLKIKGTCNHQDHAGVGVAIPDSLWEFRVRRLKDMGSNAYRSAHNPPASELLDECDRQGLLVMDENRFFNSSEDNIPQLEWLVRRDRNHPSVFMWSIFNEESWQGSEQGFAIAQRMVGAVKLLDTNRAVTGAMNGGWFAPIGAAQAVDVVGFNYFHTQYDRYHKENPTRPMISSEDTSAYMTRGEYVTDRKQHIISSYDDQASDWGVPHHGMWKVLSQSPFMAGGFVWTGFDYRGEPTPHEWPSAGSFFGIMDQCGFAKNAYYVHQAQWIDDKPILKLAPHWNWSGQEGKDIKVLVMSNAERVALFLNQKPLGEQAVDRFEMNTWKVPYAPGRLEAVGYRSGKEIARDAVETTGEPAAIHLVPDRQALKGDGWDAMPITVEVVDAKGRVVPTANPMVTVAIEPTAEIIGLGNGDPNCHEPEKGDHHSLFHGLGQIIVRATPGASGAVRLTASADGLSAGTLNLPITAAPIPDAVGGNSAELDISAWRISPITTSRPDPNQKVSEQDQNTWAPIANTKPQTFANGTWAIERAQFRPFAPQRAAGGHVRFERIIGKAEIWIDGRKVAEKTDAGAGPLVAPFPAGDGLRMISVLIAVPEAGNEGGIAGRVSVGAAKAK